MRNKGKIYPSTPSDSLSIFKLLPAAIVALTAALSLEEQEVLAYMITRSIKSTTTPFSKNKKKSFNNNIHNPPLFHCGCFHCYTTYWFRWDSSPNRELIHQVIEAFEDHLSNNQQQQQSKKKAKKRDKSGGKPQVSSPEAGEILNNAAEKESPEGATVGVGGGGGGGGGETAVSKGLARRVLPDVLGLLNSRWWSLWSPNV